MSAGKGKITALAGSSCERMGGSGDSALNVKITYKDLLQIIVWNFSSNDDRLKFESRSSNRVRNQSSRIKRKAALIRKPNNNHFLPLT